MAPERATETMVSFQMALRRRCFLSGLFVTGMLVSTSRGGWESTTHCSFSNHLTSCVWKSAEIETQTTNTAVSVQCTLPYWNALNILEDHRK
jgi:hypothetical protein